VSTSVDSRQRHLDHGATLRLELTKEQSAQLEANARVGKKSLAGCTVEGTIERDAGGSVFIKVSAMELGRGAVKSSSTRG